MRWQEEGWKKLDNLSLQARGDGHELKFERAMWRFNHSIERGAIHYRKVFLHSFYHTSLIMATDNILFQDIFDIKDLDPQGKRFDRGNFRRITQLNRWLTCWIVSRLIGRSENYEMDLTLDFNSEIYPMTVGEKFSLVLASSLSLEASASAGGVEKKESWRERAPGERDLSDEYEYVMFGKVYRYEDSNKGAAAGQQV